MTNPEFYKVFWHVGGPVLKVSPHGHVDPSWCWYYPVHQWQLNWHYVPTGEINVRMAEIKRWDYRTSKRIERAVKDEKHAQRQADAHKRCVFWRHVWAKALQSMPAKYSTPTTVLEYVNDPIPVGQYIEALAKGKLTIYPNGTKVLKHDALALIGQKAALARKLGMLLKTTRKVDSSGIYNRIVEGNRPRDSKRRQILLELANMKEE